MTWLTSDEALARLGTKPQSLYANVSRGRIRARPDPADPRRSLYHRADVERLAERHAGRRKAETLAAQTIEWGDPILPSAISTVSGGRLYYRGRDVIRLVETATLEEVAGLLWETPVQVGAAIGQRTEAPGGDLAGAFALLAARVPRDLPSLGRSRKALAQDAGALFGDLCAQFTGSADERPAHIRLAERWQRPEAGDIIRRALVLLADHELNASTFAARVAASSGASLSAAVLAGLATLSGPRHGAAWQQVVELAASAETLGAEVALQRRLRLGAGLPAFGHELYPLGDIRAESLLGAFDMPEVFADLRRHGEAISGEAVNIDFALTAMTRAFDLPAQAPIILFALARSIGWLAHAIEQALAERLIRPRARYVGPKLEMSDR